MGSIKVSDAKTEVDEKLPRHVGSVYLLDAICGVVKPSVIVEHGCGFHSTPILAKHGKVCVTDNQQKWIDAVTTAVPSISSAVGSFIVSIDGECDLVFVDGCSCGRALSVLAAMTRGVPVICCHDADHIEYYGFIFARSHINYHKYKEIWFMDVDSGGETLVLAMQFSAEIEALVSNHFTRIEK